MTDIFESAVQLGSSFADILHKFWDFFKNCLSFLGSFSEILSSIPVLGDVLVIGYYSFLIMIFVSVVVYLWKFITGGVK